MTLQDNFETSVEFQEYFQSIGYEFAKVVVDKCFELYESREQNILVLSAYIEEHDSYFDISVDKNDILVTLQQNLKLFEQEEDYYGCSTIYKLIKKIEDEHK